MAAVGTVQAGEAGVKITTLEERLNRSGGLWGQRGHFVRVIALRFPTNFKPLSRRNI